MAVEQGQVPREETRELTIEEAQALTKDLQEVLKKHNCEMGVVSSIQLMKYVESPNGTDTGNAEGEEAGETA